MLLIISYGHKHSTPAALTNPSIFFISIFGRGGTLSPPPPSPGYKIQDVPTLCFKIIAITEYLSPSIQELL